MSLFNKNNRTGGFMDEIRCDEPSYLIWKWHPAGSELGENTRENSIRNGSSLRVKDGEVAVFVYKQKNGTMQDFIEGPFDQTIKTKNFPILASLVGLAYEGGTPFQAEIYFINLAQIIQVKFAVPFFDLYDLRFTDFGVPVSVRGTMSFRIKDYRNFVKLHRLNNFSLEDFKIQIKDAITRHVKDVVANAPIANNIPLIQIETKTAQINNLVEININKTFEESFGVEVSRVDIGTIEIDKTSDAYRELISITKELTAAKIQAETADYIERLRIQREENQYAMHKQTQSTNIGAFQVEKQSEVGIAGAEALGKMGENGAGSVNLGDGGAGFNPVTMMAGMAVGGAIGQNMAGMMNNSMNTNNITPPSIPNKLYYIAVNGRSNGPYDINTLQQMSFSGQFSGDSLVWTKGMSEWVKANTVDELKQILVNDMPPIPEND